MFKVKKVMILPLLLIVLLGLLVTGCGEKEAGEETNAPAAETPSAQGLSQEELQQILTDSMLAVKNASTYTYTLDMNMSMEATGGSEPGKVDVTMKSSGVTDMVAKEMQMNFKISLDENTIGHEEGLQNISAEMYMMSDSFYMKMDIPGMGKQWMKMPFSEELKKAYNLDMVNEQLKLFESPAQTEFVRYETFDGSECYVLKIIPNMESMKQWFDQQQMTSTALNWDQVTNLMDMFKELSYITWIAKDTKLMKRMSITVLMEMNAEQFGATESDFDNMSMDVDMDMIMQNYNEPVSIILPEEAANAMEMPQMEPSNK